MLRNSLVQCVLLMLNIAAMASPPIQSSVVFQGGVDGYHTYRIPVLIEAANGDLLAFCEGRKASGSDAGDIDLLMKRSSDRGDSWSGQSVVHEEGDDAPITIGNPCVVVDATTETLWLTFSRNNERAFVVSSDDHGTSWSAPREITDDLRTPGFAWTRIGTGPTNGIQLESGRLVMPLWLNDRIGENYRSAVILSDDHGDSWRIGGIVPNVIPDGNECVIAELSDGQLALNFRNKDIAKRRAVTFSNDGGVTWSSPTVHEQLIDPQCHASLIALPSQGRMLFSNLASTKRDQLTIRTGRDDGAHWTEGYVLWAGPSAYSSLSPIGVGEVGCLFEAGAESPYEQVRFTRFTPSQIEE